MSIEIKRSDKYVDYNISAANNRGYITIDTSDWINKPWMFYELPALKFEIYTETDGELVKYQNFTREIRTYNPVYSPLGVLNVTIDIRNVPEEFILRITPIFDNDAVAARNMLIENGIENGDIWGSDQDVPTQLFNLNLEFIECDGEYIPPTPPVPPTHEETITGIPPITFDGSIGLPLVSWTILGNGQQIGTPSPDNIIIPEFVGVKTANLFDDDSVEFGKWVNSNGSIATNATYAAGYDIKVEISSEFIVKYYGDKPYSYSMAFYDSNGDFLSRVHRSSPSASYDAFPVPENAVSARFQVATTTSVVMTSAILKAMKIMLNSGSTALPYEPFGYKIPITCAEQTTPVYLGETQTVRRIRKLLFDGTENWMVNGSGESTFRGQLVLDKNNINSAPGYCTHLKFVTSGLSTDQECIGCFNGSVFMRISRNIANDLTAFKSYLASQYAAGTPVTMWYILAESETDIVNEPLAKIGTYADELSSTDAGVTIQTTEGQNTLTVDTELQPSEVIITYIKEGQ